MKRARYHAAARDELRGAVLHDEEERTGRGVDLEDAVLADQLVVLAIAHTSKKPGYWRERIEK